MFQIVKVLQPVKRELDVALPPTPGVILQSFCDAVYMLACQRRLRRQRLRRRQLETARQEAYLP